MVSFRFGFFYYPRNKKKRRGGTKKGRDEILLDEKRRAEIKKRHGGNQGEKKRPRVFYLSLFSHLTQPESTPLPTMGSSGSNPFENFRAS